MNFQVLENYGSTLKVATNGVVKTTGERGYNCCRKVFIFDDFVVKFEGNDDYYEQNKNELRFYNEILLEEDKKHFAKILGSGEQNGKLFLVQEKVVDTGERASCEQMAEFERLSENYGLEGDIEFDYEYRRNCALTSEGIKIFDVGLVQNSIYNSDSW